MRKNVLSMLLGLMMVLSLATVGAGAAELPSGFAVVDHIRSTGSGVIDTGYATANATTSIAYEIKYAFASDTVSQNQTMFGASGGDGRSGLIVERMSSQGNSTAIVFGADTATTAGIVSYPNTMDDVTLRVDIAVGTTSTYTVTKDGTQLGSGTVNGSPLSTATLYVFKNHSNLTTGSNTAASGSVYYLKIWEDGVLVRDFVPCMNSEGVYGLYDLVGGQFYPDRDTAANILGPKEVVWGANDIYLTAPSDMTLKVASGFSDSGELMTCYSCYNSTETEENGIVTHHYKLDAGNYRFMTSGEGYYRLHKNFVVTAAKSGTTIDADPGKETGLGWEQSADCPWPIYQFADEVVNSDVFKLKDSVYTDYPDAFSAPTFTNDTKTDYEFTTDAEMVAFVDALKTDCAGLYTYWLGAPDTDGNDILAAVFTKTDLSGAATIADAAELVTANGKPTVHLQAQVHGSEQSATEGALGIMKSLAGTYGDGVMDKINVVVMPRLNTYGSKYYTYGPTDGPDINLDYYKMTDTLGRTQAIVGVYNVFQPEVVIDLHEYRYGYNATDGRLTDIKMATIENLNVPQQMHDLHDVYFAEIFEKTLAEGLYGDYYRETTPNIKPTSGRGNYFTRGSVSILLEIPGQRSGKMLWERRVLAQYLGVKAILDYTVENADAVKATVASTKADIAAAGTYYDPENNLIVLEHAAGDRTHSYPMPTVDFATGDYLDPNATRSVYKYNKAVTTRPRPLAYVVSADSANIDKVLQICDWQNVKYETLAADKVLELKQYGGTASAVTLGEAQLMSFPNGAYLFPMNQTTGVVLSYLMEPDVIDTKTTPCSFVQQGLLANAEIYRCEDLSEHTLTHVAATAESCTAAGNIEHWLCSCGARFAANEHVSELEADSWVLPAMGHDFTEKASGYECSSCGEVAGDIASALSACESVGGTVTASGDISIDCIVPTGVTFDLNGHTLSGDLVVNEGGVVKNGTLQLKTNAISILNNVISLGSNGGYVPVHVETSDSAKSYALYPIAAKVGQQYDLIDGGVKYAFGYKYADYAAYAPSVTANESGLKFGVALDLDTASADYSFTSDSVAKMTEVTDAADSFYRVNLSIVGEGAEDVTVTPYVKLAELGFRYEGEGYSIPKIPVAEYGGVSYTKLEDAIAAAEAAGEFVEVKLLDDITFRSAATIKLAGTVRLMVDGDKDITISGPVTFDGQSNNASCLLFQVTADANGTASGALTLDGVTIKNYINTGSGNDNTYGAVGRVDENGILTLKNCVVENCSGTKRGVFYISGSSTVNIEESEFKNNTALDEYGGVLAIYSCAAVTVKDSTFTNNKAAGTDEADCIGGAIHVRRGPVVLENCTFSGNSALLGDDVSVTNGELTLMGTTAMGEIYLNTDKSVTLDTTFALASGASPIVIDGAVGTTVLTGDAAVVAANNESFIGSEGDAVTDEGVLGSTSTVSYAAEVNGTGYDTLEGALAAANTAAATAPVTVTLLGNGEITTENLAIGGANKITVKLADTATESVTITFSTAAAKITTAGDIEFIGGGTDASAPKIILDGGGSSISHTGTQILEANGYELALKNGVVVQNYYSTVSYSAPIRVRLQGTLTMDGAAIQNNKARVGAIYTGNHGNLNIANSSFAGNTSTGTGGGAIYLGFATTDVVITGCTFSGNTDSGSAQYGVALSIQCGGTNSTTGAASSCTVSDCTFTGNVCNKAAGVVSVFGGSTEVTMSDCVFTGNTGEAISVAAGTLTPTNVTIDGEAYTG